MVAAAAWQVRELVHRSAKIAERARDEALAAFQEEKDEIAAREKRERRARRAELKEAHDLRKPRGAVSSAQQQCGAADGQEHRLQRARGSVLAWWLGGGGGREEAR